MQDALYDKIFTVSEITSILSNTLEEMFYGLRVEGEVCNFRATGAKHWYFSIKDRKGSMLNCTCFASQNWRLAPPRNGLVVTVTGSMSFWAKGGSLSFNCSDIRLKGEGDLQAEIDKRRAYYRSLGWFDEQWKKPLPMDINTIGVVTSDRGAVIHDIMRVAKRRAPGVNIILFPSLVQGEGADRDIAKRIRQANIFQPCDVLIVGRGGGSEEDLAPYSSAAVIEAIHDSFLPVISAVGHDSDFPLSDLVADVRASTPSAAAEIATERKMKMRSELVNAENMVSSIMRNRLYQAQKRLSAAKFDRSVISVKLMDAKRTMREARESGRYLRRKLQDATLELDRCDESMRDSVLRKKRDTAREIGDLNREIALRMEKKIDSARIHIRNMERDNAGAMLLKLSETRKTLEVLKAEIRALSPEDVLRRGYSIVTDEKGKIMKSSRSAKPGMKINVKVKTGAFSARVEEE